MYKVRISIKIGTRARLRRLGIVAESYDQV